VLNASRHHRYSHSAHPSKLPLVDACAQRLAASQVLSHRVTPLLMPFFHVLNASRHHRYSHRACCVVW